MYQIHMKPKKGVEMPLCTYGSACTRRGCVYRHEKKAPAISSDASVCVAFILGKCPYGKNCYNRHPGEEETQRIRERNARTMCRFGTACLNQDCMFKHPPKEMCRYGARCQNVNCTFLHPDPEEEAEKEEVAPPPTERPPEDRPIVFPPSEAFRRHLEEQAALDLAANKIRSIPSVRAPKGVGASSYQRNPGAYNLYYDPYERFVEVNRASPPGTLDLHYLTTDEVVSVLEAALNGRVDDFHWDYYDDETKSVYIITGAGRHTKDKNRVLIFDVVLDHFIETKRNFKIVKGEDGAPVGFLLHM